MTRPILSYAERLARLWFYGTGLGVALLLVWLGWGALHHNFPFGGRPDPETGTAGLLVETDAGTGCQYIVTPWGGVVARTGADGRQVCARKP